jgi:hypothetical protein
VLYSSKPSHLTSHFFSDALISVVYMQGTIVSSSGFNSALIPFPEGEEQPKRLFLAAVQLPNQKPSHKIS